MKKIFTLALLICFYSSYSQNELIYEQVVQLDSSFTKAELFSNARQWITDNFKDANAVLTIEDIETGDIGGNGSIKYNPQVLSGSAGINGYIHFKIKIQVKDGKYKYTFYQFNHIGNHAVSVNSDMGVLTTDETYPHPMIYAGINKKWYGKVWKDLKLQTENKMVDVIASLEKDMKRHTNNYW